MLGLTDPGVRYTGWLLWKSYSRIRGPKEFCWGNILGWDSAQYSPIAEISPQGPGQGQVRM